ncbi:MAG: GNAT family N-acetyltransferase [Crocinitomicaceae bacterium]
MTKNYVFTSQRLGFRNWLVEDVEQMIAINRNKDVMRYFPAHATPEQTIEFIERMQALFHEKQYCYFAVDLLETNEFIGFIGLNDINYEAPFATSVDIGWRIAEKYWNKGYATEGAKECLNYGFNQLKLGAIVSVAPEKNAPSISVMTKIGMTKSLTFKHPKLLKYPELMECVCYEIKNPIQFKL